MLAVMGVLGIGCGRARSAVILQFVNPSDLSTGPITVQANSTFSLGVYVQGLTSPSLDSFNIGLVLPSGFTLDSFTDTIPSGWFSFPNVPNQTYGGSNWSGLDITGNAMLVQLNLTAGSNSGTVDFINQGAFQNLLDSSSNNISFSQSGIFINVISVPEPGVGVLLLVATISGAAFQLKRKRRMCGESC